MRPSIILNCTPPYNYYIPNPALGYLKGFLEARKIPVKNVYWNLILAEQLRKFRMGLEKYTQNSSLLQIFPTVYLCRQFFTENSPRVTPLDLFYSSIYSRKDIAEITHTIKECIDQYIRKYDLHKVALAGFTLKTHQWLMSSYLMKRLKELNPDINIVMGGLADRERAVKFMQQFTHADFAIYGEGEYPLLHLVEAVENSTDIKNVPSTIYREGNKILSTDTLLECPLLDEYPFADHSDCIHTFEKDISPQFFSESIRAFEGSPSDCYPVMIPVWGSRSCPWNKCRFCVLNENSSYRARSPENIVKEIEYQSKKYDADSFIFVDTELPGNSKRFKTLLKLLMKSVAARGRKYRFVAELSPVFITAETTKYMQGISFAEIQIGFEAMTDSLLEKMEKRHRFAHNIQALKLGNHYGLTMGGLNLVRGIPTETPEDIAESCSNLKFVQFLLNTYSLKPDFLQLDKGAPFYNDVSDTERKGWIENPVWTEVSSCTSIPECDRFEFFGFSNSIRSPLWKSFESLLAYYTDENSSYEWIEYPHGSFIEVKGLQLYRYTLNRDETDLLIYCDKVRTFSEVKGRFSHIEEDTLHRIIGDLKKVGMLYCSEDLHQLISVVEAVERKVLQYE